MLLFTPHVHDKLYVDLHKTMLFRSQTYLSDFSSTSTGFTFTHPTGVVWPVKEKKGKKNS